MAASDKLTDAATALSSVSDALFLSQAVLIDVTNFVQSLSSTFKSFEESTQRSR